MTTKEYIIDYYDLDDEEYTELEELGLVPDKSDPKAIAKAEELFARELKENPFDTYTDEELQFIGRMDVERLIRKHQGLGEEYMDMQIAQKLKLYIKKKM